MRVRWFPGLLLLAAGLLVLLAALVGVAIYWSQRGPGLDREVARLASLVELRAGMTVAEIGAGEGHMAVRVARRLGPSGRLYATELEAGELDAIRSAAVAAGLANVDVLEAGEHSANLPEACCDVIYMRRVYHHFTDAASINQTLYAALRPGGRLAIIDFLSPRWMFWQRHGIPLDVLVGQVAVAGFALERRVEGWSPIDYCLVFRKPAVRTHAGRPPPVTATAQVGWALSRAACLRTDTGAAAQPGLHPTDRAAARRSPPPPRLSAASTR